MWNIGASALNERGRRPPARQDGHVSDHPRGRRLRTAGTAVRTAGSGSYRRLRRATDAQGAGESGLGRVIELHLVAMVADTLIVMALASTIFFSVPTGEARSRVALSLLVTMVPFAVLAPLIGPALDRVRRGRRYALATTMVVRAFLAWVMAGAVAGGQEGLALYPAAFGFLVCQKAYIVTRAAAVPRVLPSGIGLVTANSRISLAGVGAMAVAAPVGFALTELAGPQWALRLAFAVFAAGTALALALPAAVDSSAGEVEARLSSQAEPDDRPQTWNIGPVVVSGLRGNAALRAFTGFLTLFLAFLVREEPLGGLSDTQAIALVLLVAGAGAALGTALGAVLRRLRPEIVVRAVLALTTAACAAGAVAYSLWSVLVVAAVAGVAQTLGKLSLDALVQREVPEEVRTSAFARSETVLQLAWVLGGGLGLVLPLSGSWGLGVAAVGLAAVLALTLRPTRT